MKDIIKVIKFLENTEMLLKGTTSKIKSQERGFLTNVFGLLMRISLPLTRNVLIPLARSVLLPL